MISKRLQYIVDMVTHFETIADIGCDHGYVCVELIKNNKVKKAIASDISYPSLKKTIDFVKVNKIEDKVETRVGDGLDVLKIDEVDSMIIAGMGGELIIDILERAEIFYDKKNTFILSPHTKVDEVRSFLLKRGFEIFKEDMCIDEGKFYTVIEVGYTGYEVHYSYSELLYGKYLIKNKNPILFEFLKKEKNKYINIISNTGLNEKRRAELVQRLDIIEEVINEMQ